MNGIAKRLNIIITGVLVLLNLVLLSRIKSLIAENGTLKNKVTLSIKEQTNLFEHSLEGYDLNAVIEEIRLLKPPMNILDSLNKKLIFHFSGLGCRRCLNLEMGLLSKYRRILENNGVSVCVILSDFNKDDYQNTSEQYQIQDIALQDNSVLFREKFSNMGDSIILFLGKDNRVVLSNVSDFTDENKSANFYNKILSSLL
jgi:hypothetical protein